MGEGMEVGVVGDLIMSGALAHLDNVHVDWPRYIVSESDSHKGEGEAVTVLHDEKTQKFKAALETIQDILKTMEGLPRLTEIVGFDDESNATFLEDFPC